MAQEKTTTMADGAVSKVTALPEGCTLALFDSSGGVSKIDAQKFMELVRKNMSDSIVGLNLYPGTRKFSGVWNGLYSINQDDTIDGFQIATITTNWGQVYKKIAVSPGAYVFSFMMKADNCSSQILLWQNGEGGPIPTQVIEISEELCDGQWHECFAVIQIPTSGYITPTIQKSSAGGILSVAAYKLEKGSKPTAWCPAFEDYQEIGGGKSQICKELQNLTFAPVPKAASAKRSHRRPLPQRNRILSNLILN